MTVVGRSTDRRRGAFACVAGGGTENVEVHGAKTILAAADAVWLSESSAAALEGSQVAQRPQGRGPQLQ